MKKLLTFAFVATASFVYCSQDNNNINDDLRPVKKSTSNFLSNLPSSNQAHLLANILGTAGTFYYAKNNGCDNVTKAAGTTVLASWLVYANNNRKKVTNPTK